MSPGAQTFASGAKAFDEGRFFEAHEHWETLWREEKAPPRRRLLQGLIQVAAALHKWVDKHAKAPAASLFAKGLAKLDACSPTAELPDLVAFREAVRACAASLEQGRFHSQAIPKCQTSSFPSNTELEMRWIDAWSKLDALSAGRWDVPCALPDGTVTGLEGCKEWLQRSAYENWMVEVEFGWVLGERGVVASRSRGVSDRV